MHFMTLLLDTHLLGVTQALARILSTISQAGLLALYTTLNAFSGCMGLLESGNQLWHSLAQNI